MSSPLVIFIHLAATLFMTGLIWFVQVVHYPLFAQVGDDRFAAYEKVHQRRTTWVVGPMMLVEMVTAVWLVITPLPVLPQPWNWVNLGVLLGIWIMTALVQMRQHERLSSGFDSRIHRALVLGNWWRTAAWSGRSCLLVLLMAAAVS